MVERLGKCVPAMDSMLFMLCRSQELVMNNGQRSLMHRVLGSAQLRPQKMRLYQIDKSFGHPSRLVLSPGLEGRVF